MPANLTPQYFAAEEKYRQAGDDRERLAALQEMLSAIPKHKGTEKLQADLKKKIAQLRSGSGKKGGTRRGPSHNVERSGAAQIVLVGPPNSGKSRLLVETTHATPEVAEYPFSTRTPTPGIAHLDQIPLQLVDIPPITAEHTEPWLTELVRNADLLLLFFDLGSDELLDHWDQVFAALDAMHVQIGEPPPPEERDPAVRYHRAVLAGNKCDRPGSVERLAVLFELVGDHPMHRLSLETGEGVQELLREIVHVLDLIRVYTKSPGRDPDLGEPFVFPRGTTVEGAARAIHKELAEHMKFARAWGERFHDGQPVGRDEALQDGDILEFHE